jgi:hypothetical protein
MQLCAHGIVITIGKVYLGSEVKEVNARKITKDRKNVKTGVPENPLGKQFLYPRFADP